MSGPSRLKTRPRRTPLAVAVAAVLALAACGTGEDVAEVAPSFEPSPGPPGRVPPDEMLFGDPPATPTPGPTPSPPSSPLPDPPEVRPVPVEDGDYDPREVFEAVARELTLAIANGEPEAIDLVVTEDCNCRRGWMELAQENRDMGWREVDPLPAVLHSFDIIYREEDAFAVSFEQSGPGGKRQDMETGATVSSSDPETEMEYREAELIKTASGWAFGRVLRFPDRTRPVDS